MRQAIPRVSTRGYYDLTSGKTLKKNRYYLYPKKAFAGLAGSPELAIMIHGLRNDSRGAAAKAVLARSRLRRLGYRYPVIGFSYDSNTTGAHLVKHARRALAAGQKIAVKNGRNLSQFIVDFKKTSPGTRVRLLGHSLGSQVILSAVENLSESRSNRGIVEGVYFFGASIASDVPSSQKYSKKLDMVVGKKIVNYFSPTDEVLSWADARKFVKCPLGLNGASGRPLPKYRQKLVRPKNHRFASYAAVLPSFP